MIVREHVTNSTICPRHAYGETVDALLKTDWIAKLAKDPKFHRFSRCGNRLIAEFSKGYTWNVVATIDGGNLSELEEK